MPGPIRLRSSASTRSTVARASSGSDCRTTSLTWLTGLEVRKCKRRPLDATQDPRQTVVDVRLPHPVEVPGAGRRRRRALIRQALPQSRQHLIGEHLLHLPRYAGKEVSLRAPERHHESRRNPGRVRQRPGPIRDAHLPEVVRRHLEAVDRKALLHRLQRPLVGRRSGGEQLGDHVHGPIVFRRAEPTGGDDDVHLGPQPNQRRPDGLRIVRNDQLLREVVPGLEHLVGDERRVRVADLPP